MEDILKFGTSAGIFTPDNVMSLLYGSLQYSYHTVAKTQKSECFFEWNAVEGHGQYWNVIPLDCRKELISLVIKSIKRKNCYYADFNCFHTRMECLLHDMLNDDENKVYCITSDYHMISYHRYSARIYLTLQQQAAVAEMFLWWRLGVKKSNEEKRLLKMCWERFLGAIPSRLQKQAIRQINAKIERLEAESKRALQCIQVNKTLIDRNYPQERRDIKKHHYSVRKKDFLLQQVEEKDNAAHNRLWRAESVKDRCQTALDFLKGYLDYVSMTSKTV